MKTALGMFPLKREISSNSLDVVLEACSYLSFKKPLSNQRITEAQVTEALSTLFLEAMNNDEDIELDSALTFSENFQDTNLQAKKDYLEKMNSDMDLGAYYDRDEGRMVRIQDGANPDRIQQVYKQGFFDRIYGNKYKRHEINIVPSSEREDDVSGGTKEFTVDERFVAVRRGRTIEEEIEHPFGNVIGDKELTSEVKDNLDAMNNLQDFFLYNERVDFRELLQNYLSTDSSSALEEPCCKLESLLSKYKTKAGKIVAEYLQYRQENMIPLKYNKVLF